MYEEKRSKKTRRKKGGKDKKGFMPKANKFMLPPGGNMLDDARGRTPQATMPPPAHLPFNIVAPLPSAKLPPPKQPQRYDAAIEMNTWNSPEPVAPKHNGGWETLSVPSSEVNAPRGLPPPVPPSKPVADDPNRRLTPIAVSPTPASKAVNIFDIKDSGLNESKRRRKKKKGKTDNSPNIKTDFSSSESPTKWINPAPVMPVLKQTNKEFSDFPSIKDRSGLPGRPTGFGSQTSAGSKKKRRKRKKRLNKFKSTEIKKPQSNFKPPSETYQPVFTPKPNLAHLQQKPTATPKSDYQARGRKNSKNPMSSFFGVATSPPDEAAFDNAMSKMKLKMDMKKKKTQNTDFFADAALAPKTNSREKSYQLQSKIQTQFGFLQNKFTHKERTGKSRRPRRGQNRKGATVPTLPPRQHRGPAPPQPSYSLY